MALFGLRHAPALLPPPSLKEQLVRESCAMARQLVGSGTRVPPVLIKSADHFETALEQKRPIDMVALAGTHERLARLVAPAKPGTLYLLDSSYQLQGGEIGFTPVRILRHMIRVAMLCVGVFIALSVLAMVDAHSSVDLFDVELGRGERPGKHYDTLLVVKIVLERVFWLAAAGIGASFAMLFQLNEQVLTRTFEPDESSSYWVKFFLGLVAGFILVALVPIGGGSDAQSTSDGVQALGPPTIALLGGFSASAVYRILTRMVEALESVFTGGAKEQAAAAEKAAATRANEESSQSRMAVAGQLVDLQQQIAAGLSPDQAAARLKQVVSALVPSSSEFAAPEAAAPDVPPVADPAPDAPAGEADAPAPAAPPAAQPDKVQALVIAPAPEDAAEAITPAEAPPADETQPNPPVSAS